MEDRKTSTFDIIYLKELFADLAQSNREQANTLSKIGSDVSVINASLKSLYDRVDENKRDIQKNAENIREVERKHDACDAKTQLRGLWYHVKRLNTFKDMIASKAEEDTGVIDLHAIRMQEAADRARMEETKSFKNGVIKYAPWVIVIFVLGASLATLATVKLFSGGSITDIPSVSIVKKNNGE